MKTFMEYLHTIQIQESIESLHPDLQKSLSSNNPAKEFLKTKKRLEKTGENTGLESKSFGAGSRIFVPHIHPHEITLDGKKVHIPVGSKVENTSFALNKHHPDGPGSSFGRDQNEHEHDSSNYHGMIREDHNNPGTYHTNDDGVVAPVLSHSDNHEHITQVKVEPFSSKRFEAETKSESHPKGMKFKHFKEAMEREWNLSNGRNHHSSTPEDVLDAAREHPTTEKFINHMLNTQTSPNDMSPRNMGHFKNPSTGESHPCWLDSGASSSILTNYGKARIKKGY